MSRKRQKNQLLLAFMAEDRDEFPTAAVEGIELPVAMRNPESPTRTDSLMEEVCQRDNLWKALTRVRANKGAPGVDGMTVHELRKYLKRHWPKIREQLLTGTYQPQAVKRVEIPKPDGGVRKLGIPTVLDRFIQQAVQQVLGARWDRTFSEQSYGFRPGRSAHQAVAQAQAYIAEGYGFTVDMDLEKFFDNLDWDLVMRAVRHHTDIPWILLYVERWLKAPVQRTDGSLEERTKGSPQGAVISPLLSNLFMHYAFDEWLRRHYPTIQFARYADDAVIHAKSLAQAEHVLKVVRERLKQCGLELHPEKTRIVSGLHIPSSPCQEPLGEAVCQLSSGGE